MIIRHSIRHASTVGKRHAPDSHSPSLPKVASPVVRPRIARLDIKSLELCDDVLLRLSDTLPSPGTCDLIDVNPGNGIWSQKLHALLRPRRHVLVEPDVAAYSKDFTPLLKEKGSKYRYTPLLEDVFDPTKALLSRYPKLQDAPLQQNSSLLMTVNLSGPLLKVGGFSGPPSKKFFDDLYLSLWKLRANIHRYGLIRVLAWVPDDEKHTYLPRTVSARQKQSIMLEASSVIHEVAGAPVDSLGQLTRYRKWPDMDMAESARVSKLQAAAESKTPPSRLYPIPAKDLLGVKPTPRALREERFSSDAAWVLEFLQLDERLSKDDPKWYKKYATGGYQTKKFVDEDRHTWQTLLKRAESAHKTHMKAVGHAKAYRALVAKWKQEASKSSDHILGAEAEQKLISQNARVALELSKLARTNRIFADKVIDDYRASDMQPPVLGWNQRTRHPLRVYENEFRPEGRSMALLDITARPDFLTKIDTHDKMICFRFVVTTLCDHPARSLAENLRSLVHEGYNDFIKTIPQLHDPVKGGWHDLAELRVRALPVDLFIDIALAYERWPFRQSMETIMMLRPDPQAAYSLGDDD